MKSIIDTLIGSCFKPWFHKRNIIIISEHKVKHIPIGGKSQFVLVSLLIGGVCWASYSTGSFMAARSVMKEQSQTIKSVATARVDTNLNPLSQVSALGEDEQITIASDEPMFTQQALSHSKLYARIAFLEHKVSELRNANEAIIQRVHDKTSGHIDDLESIIRQTGLSPDDLKKQVNDKVSRRHVDARSEGGPFIPAGPLALSGPEYSLYDELDKLSVLREIISNLPLAKPIANAEEQSTFGHRIDPFTGHLAFHSGLDLSGPAGSKIIAPASGKVVSAGRNGAYGNSVDVDHGFDVVTRYGHLSQILVKEGQVLKKGDVIGIQGSTGRSTGPHLHYEVRYHDKPMNPKNFLEAGRYVSEE